MGRWGAGAGGGGAAHAPPVAPALTGRHPLDR
jgi:hypothetical protein